ncbi:pyridoxamine 5'-phosphate oxidase [Streptomyces sp. di188]|nr:pyridoxamine 5'-phosphate oxidase [Streptomyces sp. di50b]SCD63259.1 pyridoxamine 5'-phosphate oxidase [Streptomyces sp. di188]
MEPDLHALLRSLRVWDPAVTDLRPLDAGRAPAEPLPLFARWLADAAAAGQPEPHTMALATADADGLPDVRIVMLHGADERGWPFATHAHSRMRTVEIRAGLRSHSPPRQSGASPG